MILLPAEAIEQEKLYSKTLFEMLDTTNPLKINYYKKKLDKINKNLDNSGYDLQIHVDIYTKKVSA